MVTANRWLAEEKIMKDNFPHFRSWKKEDKFGFQGCLTLNGRRSYEVVIQGSISTYPLEEPKILINPRPEEQHWMPSSGTGTPFLSHSRAWTPNRSTFASCVVVAIQYLQEFGMIKLELHELLDKRIYDFHKGRVVIVKSTEENLKKWNARPKLERYFMKRLFTLRLWDGTHSFY